MRFHRLHPRPCRTIELAGAVASVKSASQPGEKYKKYPSSPTAGSPPLPGQVYCRQLEQEEAKARRDRVGMSAQGVSYQSPAVFRRRMRLLANKVTRLSL